MKETTMVEKAKAGAGNISITLDGEEMELVPSYQAFVTLSRVHGGIQGAIDAVMRLDINAIERVLSLGLGYGQSKKPPKDFGEKIFRTGLTDDTGGLVGAAMQYLSVLASGGRIVEREDRDTSEDGQPDPQK